MAKDAALPAHGPRTGVRRALHLALLPCLATLAACERTHNLSSKGCLPLRAPTQVVLVQTAVVRASAKLVESAPLLAPIGRAAAGFIAVTLSAALISWIYSYTAHRPRQEAQAQKAPSPA